MDPFLDLVRVLRPKATLWGQIEAVGKWGVSFRKRDDLLFCWMEQGECELTRPHAAPVHLRADDFVLIRSSTPFTLTSDPTLEPQDSETLVAATNDTAMRVGQGTDSPVISHGGRFVFDTANEDLLTGMLPQLVHVRASDESSWRVRALMKINKTESSHPGNGSEFMIARLMELILFEILRGEAPRVNPEQSGLLSGLTNPMIARALSAMHADVAHAWTVSELARLCGVSRSTLASRFRKVVGTGPIEYLQKWRITLAKDELRQGTRSIGEIALAIGFRSSSAFSTAFSQAAGCSQKQFLTRR
jgi:AraC-like DNA-binding protein